MKLLSSALAGSALLILSGCVTPESAANSKPGDNTTAGTIMGGMIGAIAGMEMSSKDDRKKEHLLAPLLERRPVMQSVKPWINRPQICAAI